MDNLSFIRLVQKNFPDEKKFRRALRQVLVGQKSALDPFISEIDCVRKRGGVTVQNISTVCSLLALVSFPDNMTPCYDSIRDNSVASRNYDHDIFGYVTDPAFVSDPTIRLLISPKQHAEVTMGERIALFQVVAVEYRTVSNSRWVRRYRISSYAELAMLISRYYTVLHDEVLYGTIVDRKEVFLG